MPTSSNNLNILISSQFDGKGFTQATTALTRFATALKQINAGLNNVATNAQQAGKTVQTSTSSMGSNASKATTAFSGTSQQLQNITQWSTKATSQIANFGRVSSNAMGSAEKFASLNNGMMMYAANINRVNQNLSQTGTQANTTGGAFGAMGSRIGSAVSGGVGHIRNMISHTINLGDVFGFYIGMLALQAVYDLTVGLSTLKDNAITTFKFVGMGAEESTKMMDGLIKVNARMPTVNFADMLDAMKRIRLSAKMSGDEMVKFGSQVGDTITLFKENGRTAQDASLAIADAMAGGPNAFRRMYEISGLLNKENFIAHGWSGKNDDITGFFKAMDEIYKEMGVSGISTKITSVGDAIGYLTKQFQTAGMSAGDTFLPLIKGVALFLGDIVGKMPPVITGLLLFTTVLIAGTMVVMPLLAAIIQSFQTIGLFLSPLTSKVVGFVSAMQGMGSIKLPDKSTPISWKPDELERVGKNRPDTRVIRSGINPEDIKLVEKQTSGYQKLSSVMDGYTAKLNSMRTAQKSASSADTPGFFSRMKGGAIGAGAGVKTLATSFFALGKAMLVFLITNPIGWIILLVTAIITAITVTDRWGDVMKALGWVWDGFVTLCNIIVDVLIKVITYIVDAIKKGLELAGITWDSEGLKIFGLTWKQIADEIGRAAFNSSQIKPMKGEEKNAPTNQKVEVVGERGPFTGYLQQLALINNYIINMQRAWGEFSSSVEGKAEIKQYFDAVGELMKACSDASTELGNTWNAVVNPALIALKIAWNDLMIALGLPTLSEAGDNAQNAGGKVSGLKLIVDIATLGIKFFTTAVHRLTFVAQIFIGVIGAIIWVITGIVWAFNKIVVAAQLVWSYWMMLNAIFTGNKQGITDAAGAVQRLTCALVGCSPGLIPAIISVMQWVASGFSFIASTIGAWLNNAISFVWNFVNSAYSWFASLPGKISGAISSIPGIIGDIFRQAYSAATSWVNSFFEIGGMIRDKVVSSVKSAFGIASPSKTMSWLGEMMGAGIIQGINKFIGDRAKDIGYAIKDKVLGGLMGLIQMFSNWDYRFYYNSMQSIGTSIATLSGNCWDAAVAFIAMANAMGIPASMFETSVNGIPHEIVSLGNGMWFDPSGILGSQLHTGGLPGGYNKGIGSTGGTTGLGLGIAGAPIIEVNQNNPVVREEPDLDKLGRKVGLKVANALRWGL